MLWIKSLHIIFAVTWFSAIFYLPRLFVYHAMSSDEISIQRFKIMERKLYFGIAMPGAVLATLFGIVLMSDNWSYYLSSGWMQTKLVAVALLWIYHFICWKYLWDFRRDANQHGHVFYRWFNEFPVLLLFIIVCAVVVKF